LTDHNSVTYTRGVFNLFNQRGSMTRLFLTLTIALGIAVPINAQEVGITPSMPSVTLEIDGNTYTIERIQDQDHELTGGFAKTSRACPPFCIQPAEVAPGVNTVGELEVLSFLQDKVAKGEGILVDARTPKWYVEGTIPGSVNIPFTDFESDLPIELEGTLEDVGVTINDDGSYDFSTAKELLLFCNGPWCGQSPRAIRNLLALGYPAEKLHYYRGGMQLWRLLGLTVIVP